MGGVATTPRRATAAETALIGSAISSSLADTVATAAVSGATALTYNKYKIQVAKGIVKRALLT
jgi:xanthine dehydrogenase YagS FAD-binding subunit